jgi:hypothetical protein
MRQKACSKSKNSLRKKQKLLSPGFIKIGIKDKHVSAPLLVEENVGTIENESVVIGSTGVDADASVDNG